MQAASLAYDFSCNRAANDNMPATDGERELLRLLGRLEQGFESLKEDFVAMRQEATQDRAEASESRHRLYEKIEEGANRTTELESTVRIIGGMVEKNSGRLAKLEQLEPIVKQSAETIRTWTIRGGLIASGVLAFGSFVVWLVTNNWDALWKAIQGLLGSLK